MNPWLRTRVNEARLAMMLLSRVPMGRLAEPVPSLGAACWAFPLTGVVIGTLGWAALQLALAVGLGPLPAAVLSLVTLALITGGLHHDGLADLADGLGGGRDRAKCLEIMRDSRIGSFGTLALVFAALLGATSLASVAGPLTFAAFLLVAVASRWAMLLVLVALPPARGDGLGRDAADRAGAVWVPGVLVVVFFAIATGAIAIMVLAAMGLAGGAVAWAARRRLGGQTGDVLGAVQVICEGVGWVTLSALLTA